MTKALVEKSRVRERTTGQVGVLLRLGSEVSLVRWDTSKAERFVTNEYLTMVEEPK
jgi:hypothetical protein